MKYAIIILLIVFGCSEDPEPSGIGCITGINQSGDRVLIRCASKQEFNQGDKIVSTGNPWQSYTNHKWEKCGECN